MKPAKPRTESVKVRKLYKTISKLCAAFLEPSPTPELKVYNEIRRALGPLIFDRKSPSVAECVAKDEFCGIVSNLCKDCPGHSEDAYKIYSFMFLGFSIKTIAVIMGKTQGSISMYKYRLKNEISKLDVETASKYFDLLTLK